MFTSSSLVAVFTESILCDNANDGIGTICPIDVSIVVAIDVCGCVRCFNCCWCWCCCTKQLLTLFVVDITAIDGVLVQAPLALLKIVAVCVCCCCCWICCDVLWRWFTVAAVSVVIVLTICGKSDMYCDVEHSRFGDNTWEALAGVIGSAGLRLIAVDEMVKVFIVATMNRTPHVSIL